MGAAQAAPRWTGTIDLAVSDDGQSLYVQSGTTGIIDAFRIQTDGSITPIGSTTVLDAVGFEGIVAA